MAPPSRITFYCARTLVLVGLLGQTTACSGPPEERDPVATTRAASILGLVLGADERLTTPVVTPTGGQPPAVSLATGHSFAAWRDWDEQSIDGTRLDDGGHALDTAGIRIARASNTNVPGADVAVTQLGDGHLVTYQDAGAVRSALVDANGVVEPLATLLTSPSGQLWVLSSSCSVGDVASIVVFDALGSPQENDLLRVSSTGQILSRTRLAAADGATDAQIVHDESGYLVVFSQSSRIFALTLDADGVPTGGASLVSDRGGNGVRAVYRYPSYLVAWTSYWETTGPDVVGMLVDRSGHPLETAPIPLMQTEALEQLVGVGASTSSYFVSWGVQAKPTDAFIDLYGSRFDASGVGLDLPGVDLGVEMLADTPARRNLVESSDAFFTVSTETTAFRRVATDGTLPESAPIGVASLWDTQVGPRVASDGKQFLVMWKDSLFYFGGNAGAVLLDRNGGAPGARVTTGFPVSASAHSTGRYVVGGLAPTCTFSASCLCCVPGPPTSKGAYVSDDGLSVSTFDLYGLTTAGPTAVAARDDGAALFAGRAGAVRVDSAGGAIDTNPLSLSGCPISGAFAAASGYVVLCGPEGARFVDDQGVVERIDGRFDAAASSGSSTLVAFASTRGVRAALWQPEPGAALSSPIVVSNRTGAPTVSGVSWDGESFVLAWTEAPGTAFVARVTPSGEVLDPGGVLVAENVSEFRAASTADGATALIYATTDPPNGRSTRLRRRLLWSGSSTPDGGVETIPLGLLPDASVPGPDGSLDASRTESDAALRRDANMGAAGFPNDGGRHDNADGGRHDSADAGGGRPDEHDASNGQGGTTGSTGSSGAAGGGAGGTQPAGAGGAAADAAARTQDGATNGAAVPGSGGSATKPGAPIAPVSASGGCGVASPAPKQGPSMASLTGLALLAVVRGRGRRRRARAEP